MAGELEIILSRDRWKRNAIILIILMILSILIIIGSRITIQSLENSIKYYQDNYEIKCSSGETKQCLSSTQAVSYCKKDDWQLCYDDRLQTVIACNRADGKQAACVSNDYQRWITCLEGTHAACLDNTKWAVWTGSSVYDCSAGQTASCMP